MPNTLDWKPVEAPAADLAWQPVETPAPPSRLRRFVADPLISATKGAIGLPEAAVGVADIVTGGYAGKGAEAVGFRPKEAKAYLDTLYSPEQQAANAEVAAADGIIPTLRASLRNPSTIAHTVIESAPSMLGGAGVARGLVKAGVPVLAAAAAGEGVVSAGSTAEQVRQEAPGGTLTAKQAALAAGSGAATGALGVVGGRLAKRFGIADIDVALAGGAKVTKKGMAKAVAGGVVSEGLFEEAPQSAQETAAQNLATGKPAGEGVAKSAALGALTGGVMGGGTSAAFNLAAKAAGVGKVKDDLKALETAAPEVQKAEVEALAAQVHADDPVAATAMQAQTLDKLDAGESILPEPEKPATPGAARAGLLDSLAESITSGGELNPLEVHIEKETVKVLETLKVETPTEPVTVQEGAVPSVAVPAAPVENVAEKRAQDWLKAGRVVVKEGMTPDAEVAALLDDLGYTLTQGERLDRTEGGTVKRREWRVELKPPVKEAEVVAPEVKAKPPVVKTWDKTAKIKEPPVPAGMVRVYRGTGTGADDVVATDTDTKGRWFSADRETAEYFLQNEYDGKPSRLAYVDITPEQFQEFGNDPAIGEFEGSNEQAIILPAELANKGNVLFQYEPKASNFSKLLAAAKLRQEKANAPQGPTPIADGETRQAYADNPNLMIKRVGDKIALADKKSKEVLGVAHVKDGQIGEWVDGKEPATVEERAQIKGVMQEHLGVESPRFAAAWHGSPYDHNKFTTAKIGTGEGAQAYGWGLYFAQAKEVAEYYKASLGKPSHKWELSYDGKPVQLYPLRIALLALDRFSGDKEKTKEWLKVGGTLTKTELESVYKQVGKAEPDKIEISGKPRLYQVELAPKEEEYLLWDKPLSEQSEVVQEALSNEFDALREDYKDSPANPLKMTGAEFYRGLSQDGDQAASEYLHSLGIRGIKYLDGSSRSKGDGAFNYVIFSDEDVEIIEKFNRAKGAGLPAAEVRNHLALILKNLKVPVHVVNSASEVPGLKTDVKFNGVFHRGSIYLNAENLTSLAEAEEVLLKHELRHAGLRAVLSRADLDKLLAKAWGDLGSGVREFAQEKGIETKSREGKLEAVEEYIVELARAEGAHPLWDRFVELFKAALRRLGFDLKLSEAELRSLVVRAGEAMKVSGVENGETRFNADGVPLAWFSGLEKLIDQKTKTLKGDNLVPASHFKGALKEAKRDELAATGLLEFLDSRPKLTKNEVIDFLKEQQLDLQDVVLGEPSSDVEMWWTDEGGANEETPFGELTPSEQREATQRYQDEVGNFAEDRTHFDQYTEPGAVEGSYREMFVTAPGVAKIEFPSFTEWISNPERTMTRRFTLEEQHKVYEDTKARRERLAGWSDGHSQYSEIQNPVVRIRFNERNADGKRTLFVEEMQGPSDANQQKMPEYLRKRIYDLGVKRILSYAKEQGFDGVAWTTGEMQAKRYDLSKQVESIRYEKNADGTYDITAAIDDDHDDIVQNNLTPKQMLETIGKEATDKIISGEHKQGDYSEGREYGELENADLKIGGEGLKKLYDQTLPALFKKYGGEASQTAGIHLEKRSPYFELKTEKQPDGTYSVTSETSGEVLQTGLASYFAAKKWAKDYSDEAAKSSVSYVPITASTPGSFPLFKRLDDVKGFLKETGDLASKRVLSDITGNVWRSIMAVDRTIGMAKSMPLYAPIKDLLARYVVVRKSKAAATDVPLTYGHKLEHEFDKAFNTRESKENFNELVAKATLYELHADGRNSGWSEKSWEDEGNLEKFGKTLGEARAEIASMWNSMTPEQRKAHGKIIDHMKVLLDQLEEIEMAPLKQAFGPEAFAKAEALAFQAAVSTPEQLDALRKKEGVEVIDLALQISARSKGRLRGDYAPLSRFGNHIVRSFDAEGKRVKLQAFESKKKADQAVVAQQAAGFRVEYELLPEANKLVANIPEAFLNRMRAAAEKRGIKGDELEILMEDFAAARVQTMPKTSLAGTGLKREGVEGYDTDMMRSYAAYVNKAAHAIAYAKYGKEVEQIFRSMDTAIKEYGKTDGWQPHAVERMSSLKDTLYKLDKTHDAEKINEMVKSLGKISFIWYLSSPSIYAVQWSQPFLITIPKLAARHGFGKALSMYVSEAKQYMGGKFSDDKIEEFNVRHENVGERLYALIEEERKAPAERRGGLRTAMKVIYNGFNASDQKLLILKVLGLQGVLDISSSHEFMDLIVGASDGRKLSNKVVSKLAFFMQKSETGSRRAAAVASFKLAMERGNDFAQANDYTADVISDTLGDFTSENRPWLLRGNSGRLFGQFRFFQIHMLGKTIQLAKDAYLEDGWGERKKEMAYMLTMSLGLAGAAGTPLTMLVANPVSSAILAGIAMAFGDPDDPWDLERDASQFVRESMGEEAGNAFLYGLPALFGIDVHKRIGLGGLANIVNGEPPPGLTGTERAQWYAGRLAGPSFGIAADTMRAADALNEGDLVEALKMSSPKVLKDFVKGIELADKGAVGAGGRTMIQPEEISPVSVALQLLGINPAEVALAQEERGAVAKLSTELRLRRSLLLKRVTEATLDNDFDAREEALEGVNAWGLKNPAMMISQTELLGAVKRGRKARAGELSERDAALLKRVRGE